MFAGSIFPLPRIQIGLQLQWTFEVGLGPLMGHYLRIFDLIVQKNKCEKLCILYLVLGFELTTSWSINYQSLLITTRSGLCSSHSNALMHFSLSRFFLMYLINKDETEYTGQETYVWDMYQRRCWDFFPAGDCFRKQYESELEGGGGG